ncbi:EF hand protein (macronuclear) [Tetrahymena thermophila SB210]|uniref:Calmodulin n=1 Tax=Tetrahymena thermophila (strain SB210) TaxID=312017 RepID=Q23R25_TETTS|nr:EF hand protein [Tetrahymena thermophila SB210]EAR99016.1 EF hand protein [Tetrahymena thermophila SB210]|eukprot:XP_001019261.1 EF hand protein [Tetrahymena thermophila SB210]
MSRIVSLQEKIERQYMELQLDEKEERELSECFALFADSNTNLINPREIKKALETLGLDERNKYVKVMLNDLVKLCDDKKIDQLNYKEFVVTVTDKLGDIKTEKGQKKLFDLYDKNGDGFIDCDEIEEIANELCENMTQEDIQTMIHHVHVLNKTSSMEGFTLEEFKQIIASANNRDGR